MARRKTGKRRSLTPPVAQGDVCEEADLPLKTVHYPDRGGAFFGFSEKADSEIYICDCNRSALENHIELQRRFPPPRNSNPLRESPMSSLVVPQILAQESLEEGENFGLDSLSFRPKICHRCNLIPPTLSFCLSMYGGKFTQQFGWYISQAYLRLGIQRGGLLYLKEVCPEEYRTLISEVKQKGESLGAEEKRINNMVFGPDREDIGPDEVTYMHNVRNEDAETLFRLRKETSKLSRSLHNRIENVVRQEFGFRKVGEGWVSETLLHQIICRIYSEYEIIRHHRPEWLEGLELDIYIPDLNLGIEYQGQQHYHPVSAWGGEKALQALQERDRRKQRLCNELQISLLEVDYTEPLTDSHIRDRLSQIVKKPDLPQ